MRKLITLFLILTYIIGTSGVSYALRPIAAKLSPSIKTSSAGNALPDQQFAKNEFPSRTKKEEWYNRLKPVLRKAEKLIRTGENEDKVKNLETFLSIGPDIFARAKEGEPSLYTIYTQYCRASGHLLLIDKPEEADMTQFILWHLGFVTRKVWRQYLKKMREPKPFPSKPTRERWYGWLKSSLGAADKLDGDDMIKDLETLLSIGPGFFRARKVDGVGLHSICRKYWSALRDQRVEKPEEVDLVQFILWHLGFVTPGVWRQYLKHVGADIYKKGPKTPKEYFEEFLKTEALLKEGLNESRKLRTDELWEKWHGCLKNALKEVEEEAGEKFNDKEGIKDLDALLRIKEKFFSSEEAVAKHKLNELYHLFSRVLQKKKIKIPKEWTLYHLIPRIFGFVTDELWTEYLSKPTKVQYREQHLRQKVEEEASERAAKKTGRLTRIEEKWVKAAEHRSEAAEEKRARTAIIKYYRSGKVLKVGDCLITMVKFGKLRTLISGKESAIFYFSVPGKKGKREKVVFLAEEDPNHGLVLNTYYFTDYEKGDTTNPIHTWKYVPKLKKIVKIDLGEADIIYTAYLYRKILTLGRVFRTKIIKGGLIYCATYKKEDGTHPDFLLKIPDERLKREEGLIGKDVVVLVEDDKNRGQVINAYLASDYNNGKRSHPLVTYKFYKDIKRKGAKQPSRAIPIRLSDIDVIDAYEGKELAVYNRTCKAMIREGGFGTGICTVTIFNKKKRQRIVSFTIPRKRMRKRFIGKHAIIRVEKDKNRGQIINVYLESEFENKKVKAKSLVTYKHVKGKKIKYKRVGYRGFSRPVNLADLDIIDYRAGEEVKPVEGRISKLALSYSPSSGEYEAGLYRYAGGKRKPITFRLPTLKKPIFDPQHLPRYVNAAIKEDRDYGAYIEISHKRTVLVKYYYFKSRGQCTTADFSRMAFLDYIFGEKNINGEDIPPRKCYFKAKVDKRGILNANYRERKHSISELGAIKGKGSVFIPKKNKRYGYIFHVHDVAKYEKNKKRKPDIIMARDAYFKRLIPMEKIELFKGRQFYEMGLYSTARSLLGPYVAENPSYAWAKMLYSRAKNGYDDILEKLKQPRQIHWKKRFDFYIKLLADSIISKDDLFKRTALAYFDDIMFDAPKEKIEKITQELEEKLDFKSNVLSQAVLNIAILQFLSKLPCAVKSLALVKKVAEFIDYKGPHQKEIVSAGIDFFESIPNNLVFQKSKKQEIDTDISELLEKGKVTTEMGGITQYIQQSTKSPLLTRLGEIKLAILARYGDKEASDQLILSNVRLVIFIAKKHNRWSGFGLLNLAQEGMLGLISAAKNWHPLMGTKFGGYAGNNIEWHILTYIRENKSQIKMSVWQQLRITDYKNRCAMAGIGPGMKRKSYSQIAEAIGMDVDEVKDISMTMHTIVSISKPSYPGKEADQERESTIETELVAKEAKITELECIEFLAKVVMDTEDILRRKWRRNPGLERNIEIFRLRILPIIIAGAEPGKDTKTGRVLAKQYNISKQMVSRIEIATLKTMGEALMRLTMKDNKADVDYIKSIMEFSKNRWVQHEIEEILWARIADVRGEDVQASKFNPKQQKDTIIAISWAA